MPDRLLSAAAALLPAERREWVRAMRAELVGIEGAGARTMFALGCLRAVLTRPAVLRTVGYPVLMAGAVVTVLGWSRSVGYPPLRWGLVAVVGMLVAIAWLGRRPGPLGPVADALAARMLRACAYVLVAVFATPFVAHSRSSGDPVEQARIVPIVGAVLAIYLTGFLVVTARPRAGRVLRAAAGAGAGAVAVWLLAVRAAPPIPASASLAIVLTGTAAVVAAYAAGRRGSTDDGLVAAACAAALAALLIVILVVGLSSFATPRFIPDLAPAALTAADGLRQSRSEVQDPYVAVLLLGCLPAALLSIVGVATRYRKTITGRHDNAVQRPTR